MKRYTDEKIEAVVRPVEGKYLQTRLPPGGSGSAVCPKLTSSHTNSQKHDLLCKPFS